MLKLNRWREEEEEEEGATMLRMVATWVENLIDGV